VGRAIGSVTAGDDPARRGLLTADPGALPRVRREKLADPSGVPAGAGNESDGDLAAGAEDSRGSTIAALGGLTHPHVVSAEVAHSIGTARFARSAAESKHA
jgi:hypothetical protein